MAQSYVLDMRKVTHCFLHDILKDRIGLSFRVVTPKKLELFWIVEQSLFEVILELAHNGRGGGGRDAPGYYEKWREMGLESWIFGFGYSGGWGW